MLRLARLWLAASGPAMTPRTALRILSLSPSADLSHSVIKKAYVKQTLLCHPDLHPNDPEATEKFRNLSDALSVALRALEVRQGLSQNTRRQKGQADGGAEGGEDPHYDSQGALEALRLAIHSYRLHHESCSSSSSSAVGSASDAASPSPAEGEDRAYFSPSLEYVSEVC